MDGWVDGVILNYSIPLRMMYEEGGIASLSFIHSSFYLPIYLPICLSISMPQLGSVSS